MKAITNQKNEAVIRAYFKHGVNGKLVIFPGNNEESILRQFSGRSSATPLTFSLNKINLICKRI